MTWCDLGETCEAYSAIYVHAVRMAGVTVFEQENKRRNEMVITITMF